MTTASPPSPRDSANTLGLDYRAEAAKLPYRQPIWDVHTHLADVQAARLFFRVADDFGIQRVWSMTQLEQIDAIRAEFGQRVQFIAVPNYPAKDDPRTFTTDWLWRIEQFAEKGVRVCKFWAPPRGLDMHPEALRLDSPLRRQQMKLAASCGMMFMTHVADPDTWFAAQYADAAKYGTKAEHHERFERLLDEFPATPWLAAHMAGHPEDLLHLQRLLDAHPNLYLDTAAAKWMVRELSKHSDDLRDFCRRNPGRVLFGSDIVALPHDMTYDLLASRYWALRVLLETDYVGPSPIVDPDLALLDPSQPANATAHLRGAMLAPTTLQDVYHDAAQGLMPNEAPQ